jgi:hypothetical protein
MRPPQGPTAGACAASRLCNKTSTNQCIILRLDDTRPQSPWGGMPGDPRLTRRRGGSHWHSGDSEWGFIGDSGWGENESERDSSVDPTHRPSCRCASNPRPRLSSAPPATWTREPRSPPATPRLQRRPRRCPSGRRRCSRGPARLSCVGRRAADPGLTHGPRLMKERPGKAVRV